MTVENANIPEVDTSFEADFDNDMDGIDEPLFIDEDEDYDSNEEPEEMEEMEQDDEIDENDETPPEEDELNDDTSKPEESDEIQFDEAQQEKLNEIVQQRLERQEQQILKDLSETAGTQLSVDDVTGASKLWGLLKENPQLSSAIDRLISDAVNQGQATAPSLNQGDTPDMRMRELDRREAVLNFKAENKTFNKNADKILQWAKDQGMYIYNDSSLKMAFYAWKGANSDMLGEASKQYNDKRRKVKSNLRKKANTQSAKGVKSKAKLNYKKMSDDEVLAAEGLSLFT